MYGLFSFLRLRLNHMQWNYINKTETRLFKGMAILMIVMHNFMAALLRPKQNEFAFKREYFDDFIYLVFHEPENIIRWTFAYLGHYGVQVFIFLSAYGLTKKYLYKSIDYRHYLLERVAKIYPSFIIAIIIWAMLRLLWSSINGSVSIDDFMIDAVLLKITFLSNFVSGYALKPVGPWWFLPFIVQFYIIYPVLLKSFEAWGKNCLILVSLISMLIVVLCDTLSFNFYFTVLPHIPEFCLGIYMAKMDTNKVEVSNLLMLLMMAIFLLGNVYKPFWYLTHLSALVIIIMLLQIIIRTFSGGKPFDRFFLFMGTLSMQLFLVHGFLRTPLADWALVNDNWLHVIFLCIGYLIISIIVSYGLFSLEGKWRGIKLEPRT